MSSLHDTVEPLDPSRIQQAKQIKLSPGEVAVVFSPEKHGMIAQRVVSHPQVRPLPEAQAIAMLLTWATSDKKVRERLQRKLDEIKTTE
ncbi:MAG: hypothetical protein NVV63_12600 [Opitutus sp.]|nr:hypothetical protein [Opitutus sp.]